MLDKLSILKENILFKDLDEENLNYIAGFFDWEEYKQGEYLFFENSPRKKFLIIVEGDVEITKNQPAGEKSLAKLSAGDFLGEGIFLDDYLHTVNAKAVTDVKILSFYVDKLHVLKRERPFIYYFMMKGISKLLSKRLKYSTSVIAGKEDYYTGGKYRVEHDLLGERAVPDCAYYGIQTLRAVENFPITGIPLSHFPNLIKSLAMVKKAAALANKKLGFLEPEKADAIAKACDEIIDGALHNHFVVDVIQGGAGTSTNMNANEVIANRALEILGHKKGEYKIIHPNNHVNLSQSTNDAYPTAVKLGLIFSIESLEVGLNHLINAFRVKEQEFADVIKMGRTQLQDAVPMTLGQEFGAYATMLEEDLKIIHAAKELLTEINMGGTAIGTGINADPDYPPLVVDELRNVSGVDLKLSKNLVEATQDTGAFVQLSGVFKRLAVKLSKISNDLRLLSSGPRAGFHEINLPPVQPGSSIMPGKVNPVIPEVVNQVAFQVIGNDLTITFGAEAGQLELNVMEPIITFNLFQSIDIMRNAMITLADKCVIGITANREVCRHYVENSIGIVTALNPFIGYENATAIAKEALETGKSVYELVLEKGLLTKEELDKILSPEEMVKPRHLEKNR